MSESARVVTSAPTREPWPVGASFGPEGLQIAGITAEALAAHHGTPLLVVDEDDLRARCRAMRARFPRVFYAVKAFTAHAVVRIAVEEGLDLLVASEGELEAALRAGVPASRIALHGNNKSDHELEAAVGAGVALVVIDHAAELERLNELARGSGAVQDVLIRVIPEIRSDTHPSIATGHAGSTFGIPLIEVVDAVRRASELDAVRFAGLHAHLGSQLLDERPYLQELEVLLGLVTEIRQAIGCETQILDVGGGFGVRYTDERALDVDALSRAVMTRVEGFAAAAGFPPPVVAVEPGRSLIANAVCTLYQVGVTKEVGGRRLAAVDGGMSDNPRPSLYDARYTVVHAGPPRPGVARPFTVVGRHCESGDVLVDRVDLPADLHAGDLIAVAGTGAYTYAMASNYNRSARPAVVGV
nr:diaminopimelate decarboxylase [Actinomycetota bacterium]